MSIRNAEGLPPDGVARGAGSLRLWVLGGGRSRRFARLMTQVGGADELVGRDEAGVLVAREPRSVGAALARLASDPELRARMGEAGRRHCLEHTAERYVASVFATYERLLASDRSGGDRVRPARSLAAVSAREESRRSVRPSTAGA